MTKMMMAWRVSQFGLSNLELTERPVATVGRNDLLVRVRAVALNYKDRMMIDGTLVPGLRMPYVPSSDAAGEVVEIGEDVTRFRPGERVLGQVVADWIDGDGPATLHEATLGMTLPGVLSEYIVLHEDAAVAAPPSLTDVQASTLQIAALTAWTALVELTKPVPGSVVVAHGTGGVALFAMQFAAAFGLRPIITSRSDDKLARAKELGAWLGINTATSPAWDDVVREATGGHGADHVLETVGGDNVRRSANALAAGGRLSLIGLLAGADFTVPIIPFMRNRTTLQGVSIGHRKAFERMNRAIETNGIVPVVDACYSFKEARSAFEHLTRGPFGKVVISLA